MDGQAAQPYDFDINTDCLDSRPLESIDAMRSSHVRHCVMPFGGRLDDAWLAVRLRQAGITVTGVHVSLGRDRSELRRAKAVAACVGIELLDHDGQLEFADRYVAPALRGGALQSTTSLGWPFVISVVERIARELDADAVAIADPIERGPGRFNLNFLALEGKMFAALPLIADRTPRDERAAKLARLGVEPEAESIPPFGTLLAPDIHAVHPPTEITLTIMGGLPVALDDQPVAFADILEAIECAGRRAGVARPAETILATAHRAIEAVTLDEETLAQKRSLEEAWTALVLAGAWHTELASAYRRVLERSSESVNGRIILRLQRGVVRVRTVTDTTEQPGDTLLPVTVDRSIIASGRRQSPRAGRRHWRHDPQGPERRQCPIPGRGAEGPTVRLSPLDE